MNRNDPHDMWRDYFLAKAVKQRGLAYLPVAKRVCGDCEVKTGFYMPIIKNLKCQRKDMQIEIASKWHCHDDHRACCRGIAEFLGIVENVNRRADPSLKRCPNCTDELVLVKVRKELAEFGSLPAQYHYCQRCKVRTEG